MTASRAHLQHVFPASKLSRLAAGRAPGMRTTGLAATVDPAPMAWQWPTIHTSASSRRRSHLICSAAARPHFCLRSTAARSGTRDPSAPAALKRVSRSNFELAPRSRPQGAAAAVGFKTEAEAMTPAIDSRGMGPLGGLNEGRVRPPISTRRSEAGPCAISGPRAARLQGTTALVGAAKVLERGRTVRSRDWSERPPQPQRSTALSPMGHPYSARSTSR